MMSVRVRIDEEPVLQDLRRAARDHPKLAKRSMIKALKKVRTEATRAVAEAVGIKKKPVRDRMIVPRRQKLVMVVLQLPILARHLGPPKGLKRTGRVKSGQKTWPHGAFVATMPSGKTLAMRRKGPARLPIKEESVSVGEEMEREVPKAISAHGTRAYRKEFTRLLAVWKQKRPVRSPRAR